MSVSFMERYNDNLGGVKGRERCDRCEYIEG